MSEANVDLPDVDVLSHRRAPHEGDNFRATLSAARDSLESLGRLLDDYRSSLQKFAEISLPSDMAPKVGASDLVQQTLLEATQGFADFRGESREQLSAWMNRILMRNLLNELRKWRCSQMRCVDREVRVDGSAAPLIVSEGKTPSSVVARHEHEMLLHDAMKQLPPDQQEVIRLRHFEQLDFVEVARRMDRKYSATRMLWYRAFENLMRNLGGRA